jgi:hypothetical protein
VGINSPTLAVEGHISEVLMTAQVMETPDNIPAKVFSSLIKKHPCKVFHH